MLVEHITLSSSDQKPIRDGFGEGLVEAARRNPNVVGLCADLTESTRMQAFKDEFPERFIQIGVAEQNLVTVASGLAAAGKIPYIASYATFSPGRNWEQIRTTVCYNNVPVKIAGHHAGLSVGPDGATHQSLEDIALMRVLPNMTVVVPCDAIEAKKATIAALVQPTPVYIRLNRAATTVFTSESSPFEIGRAEVLAEGSDVTIFACGSLVYDCLVVAHELMSQSISVEVINVSTIKPLDGNTVLSSVRKTKRVVTVEEHQVAGGLGSAIAEFLGEHFPVRMKRLGILDLFGQSGEPNELMTEYGLTKDRIQLAVKESMNYIE
ncbi:transketolase family protein [candidate division WWE3 bacterium]|nr:transketolase family protein [candidate division WWE3 bacterium]